MKSQEIRQSFVDYFVGNEHRPVSSASLVPHGDPTLLFTNAGMVQFKDFFLGSEQPQSPRAVTVQKCLRVSGKHNDLENVGPSPRHHTFFEMLGNFSFGDYFKERAIEFGWDLVTRVWGLPAKNLFATVYEEDDEAHELWCKISSLAPERVIRCGKADNFWAMGDTGPCGPCSEILIDQAPHLPPVAWDEGAESGRYLELWNLVFMQYERDDGGELHPLPNPSIDTGAGLERVAAVLQGVTSNYDTDLFQPILLTTAELAGKSYGRDPDDDVSLRVIADHLRAVSFLLADGVIPSNEGRGYVVRRVLRRAVRHGMRLGFDEPFLHRLLPVLGEVMGEAYPELAATREASLATTTAEEEKFLATVATGARQVQDAIEGARHDGLRRLPGQVAFRLYDTFGLPLEMIREIAEEEQLAVDEEGFQGALEEQRQRSRVATTSTQEHEADLRVALAAADTDGEPERIETEFQGYDQLTLDSTRVVRLVLHRPGADVPFQRAQALESGQEGIAILEATVFYAESGGQVGDRGEIGWPRGRASVVNTHKGPSGLHLHSLRVVEGELCVGTTVSLRVDAPRRHRTENNHTATHLLHAALRQELGEGVRQAGSLVHPQRLRFDFTHPKPLSVQERDRVEERVREWIRRAVPTEIQWRPYDEAIADGAMALFGEKYGERVRTVAVPGFSLELCGGCHVVNTGQIGGFVITSERGVASGVRRIEALTAQGADEYWRQRLEILHQIEEELGVSVERGPAEISSLKSRLRELEREVAQMRLKLVAGEPAQSDDTVEVAGIKVLAREVPPAPSNELRSIVDVLRGRLGSGVVVLGTRGDGKVNLVTAVTSDLTQRLDAGALAKRIAGLVGGSGGGRRDFAQAGGREPKKLPEALGTVGQAVAEQLEQG